MIAIRRGTSAWMAVCTGVFLWCGLMGEAMTAEPMVFPGNTWESRPPESLGLATGPLEAFARAVGGDGCIIRGGYLVKSWGDLSSRKDWASAAKPVLSTLLLLAVEEGRLDTVDAPVSRAGWGLTGKDRPMTFRHLADMTSGYARAEAPGTAWAYNDVAIELYARSLERLFATPLDEAVRSRLSALQFEDGGIFGSRRGVGVNASPRDFARIGWLWLNRGRWGERQLISERLFAEQVRAGVPTGLPRTQSPGEDYLKVGSYGGGTDQTAHGPGVYGFNFWFNERLPNGERVWPALPPDAYQANGMWNRDTVSVIPSLRLVAVVRGAPARPFEPGTADGRFNQTLGLLVAAARGGPDAGPLPRANHSLPLDLNRFRDSAHHWRKIRDDQQIVRPSPHHPSFPADHLSAIADNILLYQRTNGGWPKNYDMTAILTAEQKDALRRTQDHRDTTFDNGTTHSQVSYLAQAFTQEEQPAWRAACLRGLDFILAAQLPSGGFPQRFPGATGYQALITFNDGAMVGCLRVLQDAATGTRGFAWLDADRRQRARTAVARGIDCLLRCQIQWEGRRTGWCQQHDPDTFAPRSARSFELASLSPPDTTEIVRFLMQAASPTPELVAAVEGAAAWLERVRLSGIRVERVPAPHADYPFHSTEEEVVVVPDPDAPPLWARHYEIGTDRPLFSGRDSIPRFSLAEIERERRTGTAWYGRWPQTLLEKDLPTWRETLAGSQRRPGTH